MNQHHVALILSGNRVVAIDPWEDRSEEIRAAYQRIDELETQLAKADAIFEQIARSDFMSGTMYDAVRAALSYRNELLS